MTLQPRAGARTLATALIALASLLGLNAVSAWVTFDGGIATITLILLATATAVALTRAYSPVRALPSLVGIVVAIVVSVPFFSVGDDGSTNWLPTPEALGQLGDVARDGVNYAAITVAPADLTAGLTLLIALAVVATFLASDLLGVGLGFAASAGIILLAPWLPAVILDRSVPILPLMVAVGCWIATLGLMRRGEGARRTAPPLAPPLLAATAVVLVATIVSPLLVSGPGWGSLPRFAAAGPGAEVTRLSLDLDLRASLGARSSVPVLRYTTDGGRPSAFKFHTVSDFNGVTWADTGAENLEPQADDAVLWSAPVDDWEEQRLMTIALDPVGVGESNLPLPTAPRVVETDASWEYDAQLDEAEVTSGSARGQELMITAATSYVTGERLLAAQDNVGTELDAVPGIYLELPDAMDAEGVLAVAQEVTADATTRHEQAVALQQYLRNPMEFTYDTSVQDSTDDAVSTFLDERSGYCVQFATAMTMMARTLSIPARLAVGYLPGQINSEREYVVTGSEAHAWPELWFPGVGWVRFEPTPAVQTGSAPWYATNAAVDTAAAPDASDQITPKPEDEELPEEIEPTTEGTSAPVTTASSDDSSVWWLVALAGVLLLTSGIWAYLRHRASRPPEAAATDGVWARLYRDVPDGMRWPESLTPTEAVEYVRAERTERGDPLPTHADDALAHLAHAVTAYRYDPAGTDVPLAHMNAWRATVVDALKATGARK
ncbi:transglutaminase family protein [Demequina flava]|uniref:transglutaminase family protein n=1 Tax=Demequina flava TaxID=1095025 RepID=UPI00078536D1|nr:DUF3488 and transglutaminase-like domain-containing protein [Demequina flava]